jgi:hypothetical protein
LVSLGYKFPERTHFGYPTTLFYLSNMSKNCSQITKFFSILQMFLSPIKNNFPGLNNTCRRHNSHTNTATYYQDQKPGNQNAKTKKVISLDQSPTLPFSGSLNQNEMQKHFICKPACCASLRVFDYNSFNNQRITTAIQRL